MDAPLGGEVRQVIFCCSPTKFGSRGELPQARAEVEAVAELCRESCPSEIIEGTTAADLRRELGKRTAVASARFLFCGHADMEVAGASGTTRTTLGFTNAEGGVDLVQPDTLAEILGAYAPSKGGKLQLVFLNGCSSYQLGEAVHKAGIPFVVCWHTMVHDEAARIFSEAFYTHLERPRATYADAFEQAKLAVLEITIPKQGDDGHRINIPKFALEDPAAGNRTAAGAQAAGIPQLFHATKSNANNDTSSEEGRKSRSKSPQPKSNRQKEINSEMFQLFSFYGPIVISMVIMACMVRFGHEEVVPLVFVVLALIGMAVLLYEWCNELDHPKQPATKSNANNDTSSEEGRNCSVYLCSNTLRQNSRSKSPQRKRVNESEPYCEFHSLRGRSYRYLPMFGPEETEMIDYLGIPAFVKWVCWGNEYLEFSILYGCAVLLLFCLVLFCYVGPLLLLYWALGKERVGSNVKELAMKLLEGAETYLDIEPFEI
jgi:hypothetical protein